VRHDRVGQVHAERHFSPRPPRLQDVQANARDDGRQPPVQVLDGGRISAAEPQPGFLDRVVGIADGAEHPVGHRAQASSILLESLRQPVALVHRSHS
jgi:hypothetical protein